jgi:hypothetical protein
LIAEDHVSVNSSAGSTNKHHYYLLRIGGID